MAEDKISTGESVKNSFKKNKKPLLIAAVIFVVIVASTLAFIFSVNKTVDLWANKIYPGVEVYGVSLGGLAKEDGLKVIEEELIPKINEKKITIKVRDSENVIRYGDIAPSYDAESILANAMEFGKNESLFKKKSLIDDQTKHELKPDLVIDQELLAKKEAEIISAVNINPKDAKVVSMNGGTPTIEEEVIGYTINAEEFHNKIVESIGGNPLESTELSFELHETKPRITATDLGKIDSRISTYSTKYNKGADPGRDKNLEVAANYINGIVLMPGDVFSYAETIGQTTPEKGYHKANVYVGNKVEKDYGGGVCQISTTLYRAAMKANLRSVERRNHSMTVGYADLGLDATYAHGYIDYKFKNEYDFPVYIQAYVTSNQVIFSMYGNNEGMAGKTYEMSVEVLETLQPEVVRKKDSSLPAGTEVVESYGKVGYKVKSFQNTYENGTLVNTEYIATDTYLKQDKVIKYN